MTKHYLNGGVPTWDSAGTIYTAQAAGAVPPADADYLVGTAHAGLSAEIVVGTTPGGELGGTWAAPTVDATHSGSTHADFIAKALVDAKGDVITATADNTPVRKAVGADGTALVASAAAGDGLVWGTPAVLNFAAATTLGTVVGKVEIFDAAGASLGFLPVYDAIT